MGLFTRCAPSSSPRFQRGFTLLELLVVLVVLGLLAGIVAPKYFSQLGRSQAKVARAVVENVLGDAVVAIYVGGNRELRVEGRGSGLGDHATRPRSDPSVGQGARCLHSRRRPRLECRFGASDCYSQPS